MKIYTKVLLVISLSPFLAQPLIAANDKGSQCTPSHTPVNTEKMTGTVTTLPNCNKVFKPTNGAPYCLVGCDVPVDCKGNDYQRTLESGKKWACAKESGGAGSLCEGKCYQTDKKTPD